MVTGLSFLSIWGWFALILGGCIAIQMDMLVIGGGGKNWDVNSFSIQKNWSVTFCTNSTKILLHSSGLCNSIFLMLFCYLESQILLGLFISVRGKKDQIVT